MNYKRFHLNLIHLNTVDSTNNFTANLIKTSKVVNGTTILTKRQINGRGQHGNLWQSADDKNLICSTVIYPEIKAKEAFYLNIICSLAVQKTLEDLKIPALIKWPNDILVNDKKIAGILIENQVLGQKISSSIFGLGLNVNQVNFMQEINATSIINEIGHELLIEDLFNQYFAYLDFYLDHLMNFNFDLLKKRYYSKLYGYEKSLFFEIGNQKIKAIILGIADSGKLILEMENKEKYSFDMQEIKFILQNE